MGIFLVASFFYFNQGPNLETCGAFIRKRRNPNPSFVTTTALSQFLKCITEYKTIKRPGF